MSDDEQRRIKLLERIERERVALGKALGVDDWGFTGPCVHGRDPWTRCDKGCDTEEQARGLKPPTPCCSAAADLAAAVSLARRQERAEVVRRVRGRYEACKSFSHDTGKQMLDELDALERESESEATDGE